MYKTKDITPEELNQIEIRNQAEIVQYIGSELNLLEAHQLIKKESKDFTVPNAQAEKADALLYDLVHRTSSKDGEAGAPYTTSDGFTWNMISIEEARKRFKDNQEVFGIHREEETEHLITNEKDFESWEEFGVEPTPEKKKDRESLTNEQIRILKVKKETELALLALRLKLKRNSA